MLETGRRNWYKTEGLKTLGWVNLVQVGIATTMKTALKVLHNKSPQNLYQALVHTEDDMRKMTKIQFGAIGTDIPEGWQLGKV